MTGDSTYPANLSAIIGDIYDCAIDPTRWPTTMERLNRLFNCAFTGLFVTELEPWRPISFHHSDWDRRLTTVLTHDYLFKVPGIRETLTGPMGIAGGLVERLDAKGIETYHSSEFYQTWVKPQGLYDSCLVRVAQTRNRSAALSIILGADRGPATPQERMLLEFLAPHVSRAVLIGDLLEERKRAAHDLGQLVNALASPVIVADADANIVHANDAAMEWMDTRAGLTSLNGRLAVREGRARRPFLDALARSAEGDREAGAHGIGLPLGGEGADAAACYMLPLNDGDARPHFDDGRVALFVSQASHVQPVPETMLSAMFGLTPAEARLTRLLQSGLSLGEAEARLNISANTAKYHMRHIFEKTGTGNQKDLQLLTDALAPVTRAPTQHDD